MKVNHYTIKYTLLLTGLISLIMPVQAKHLYKEADYQQAWCGYHNGSLEVVQDDFVRVDCVTKTHSIEFDFSSKWAESVGQSEYYALKTHKKAGIVLIMENPETDKYYLQRVLTLAKKYKLDVWTMENLTDFDSKVYTSKGIRVIK